MAMLSLYHSGDALSLFLHAVFKKNITGESDTEILNQL